MASSKYYQVEMANYKGQMDDFESKKNNKLDEINKVKEKIRKLEAYKSDLKALKANIDSVIPKFQSVGKYLEYVVVGKKKYDDDYFKNSTTSLKKAKDSCNNLINEVTNEITKLNNKLSTLKNEYNDLCNKYNTAKSNYQWARDNWESALAQEQLAAQQNKTTTTTTTYYGGGGGGKTTTGGGGKTTTTTGGSSGKTTTSGTTSSVTPTKKNTCFLKGTKVYCKNNNKNIEDIKSGDLVLTYNEETKEQSYKEVKQLIIHNDCIEKLITLEFDNYKLDVTEAHRFYIHGKWIEAGKLKVNDEVMYIDNSFHKITSIKARELKETYYNLEVKDNHNYYVSDKGVLVHNVKKLIA